MLSFRLDLGRQIGHQYRQGRQQIGHRVGQDGFEQPCHPAGQLQVALFVGLAAQERLHGVINQPNALKPLRRRDSGQRHPARLRKTVRLIQGQPQRRHQFNFVQNRRARFTPSRRRLGINGQRVLQGAKDAHIVHDQARLFARRHAVGPRDGLHQRVCPHRLVQVDGRAGGHVKAGDPHGADKHQPQRRISALELLSQVFLEHALAMGHDVQPLVGQVFHLVLPLRHHHRHVRGLHQVDAGQQRLAGVAIYNLVHRHQRRLQPRNLGQPSALHLVIHAHRRGLVDTHHHGFAPIATPGEMRHQVFGNRVQPVFAGDDVVLAAKLALQLFLLVLVQLGGFQQGFQILIQVLIGELHLGDAVLVIQRHGGAVFNRAGKVIHAHIVAKHLARALVIALDQRRAGKAQKARVWQRVAHVQRKNVVLAAMRLVGDHDHI